MKKTVSKVVLSISIACLCACNAFAAGWESFVPDITVFAIFDASNKEIENATKQDISLHGYMDEVLRMQNEYRATTNDLIDNARFAYGDRKTEIFPWRQIDMMQIRCLLSNNSKTSMKLSVRLSIITLN